MIAGLLATMAAFVALGVWQVQRLAWKEALIARVTAAIHAPPVGPGALPRGDLAAWAYHTVALTGAYDARGVTLVTATTDLGPGYWVMTPLRASGAAIYVNRGFVPAGTTRAEATAMTPSGARTVTGLLRLTEPGGTWLRANRPAAGRWYSRDVAAMARTQGVAAVEPRWFLDARAEMPAPPPGGPVPGLTIIAFPDNHLQYALTWFAMALLAGAAILVVWRRPP